MSAPEPTDAVARIFVRWSDDGQHIRKWAREAFREGEPVDAVGHALYPLYALETAACLWEAVHDMERADDPLSGSYTVEAGQRAKAIRATREEIGSATLRMTVVGWVDAVEAAWKRADVDADHPQGGAYGRAFDWEFVPEWIAANVDWSNPSGPVVRS